jgi:ribA/ribD-fused uncharacterized protein
MSIRTYDINDVITFRKTTEAFGGLSNMSSGYSLNINGIIVKSAEHLYQAMRYPLNPEIQAEILNEHSPMTAKMISKKYREKFTRPDWDLVRFQIMKWVLEVKLSQNWATFSNLLLQTENKAIVEFTPKDKVWGAVLEGTKLTGTNALGRLLMSIRETFVKTNNYQRCVHPVDIPGFLLFNTQIELVCNDSFNYDLIESDNIEIEFA